MFQVQVPRANLADSIFDAISYSKSASVIRMVRFYILIHIYYYYYFHIFRYMNSLGNNSLEKDFQII